MIKIKREDIGARVILIVSMAIAIYFSPWMIDWINIIFISLMIGSIVISCTVGIRVLNTITKELEKVTIEIKEQAEENTYQNLWEELRENLKFNNAVLDKRFESYKEEMDRLYIKNQQMTTCDIEEYINEELLERASKKHINDQISGILTGLGVLGTFIGLAIGLQSFDTTTVETMTTSIEELIEGIKIAFCTSISGVILSIGFTSFYKVQVGKSEEALEKFLQAFTKYVVPDSEHQRYNQLISLGKTQSESMTQFAETLSIQLAKSLDQFITPTMDRLTGVIDQITTGSLANQQQGVERIVDGFINSLNESMGNQFRNLGQTIEHLCEWQQDTMAELKKVTDEICITAKEIKSVNECSKDIIVNMESYTQSLQHMQNKSTELLEKINQEREQMFLHQEKQNSFIMELIEQESSIRKAVIDLEETTLTYVLAINEDLDSHKGIVNESRAALAQVTQMTQESMQLISIQVEEQGALMAETTNSIAEEVSKLLNDHSESFRAASQELGVQLHEIKESLKEQATIFEQDIENVLERSFETFDENLSEICQRLSGTISGIQKATERVPAILNLSYESMQGNFDVYLKSIETMCKQVDYAMSQNNEQRSIMGERA